MSVTLDPQERWNASSVFYNESSDSNSNEIDENNGTVPSNRMKSYRVDFTQTSKLDVFLLVFSTCINFFIFLIICFKRKYRKRTNFLIANLSLASTMYNSIFMFRYLEYNLQLDLNYQTGLCGVFAVLHRFPMPVMSMTTMAISLERSHSATATAPFHLLPSRSWTAFKVIIIWSISILITLPAAVINIFDSNATYMSPRKCKRILLHSYWVHVCYTTIHVAIVFVIPAAVLISELLRMRSKIKFLIWRQDKITCRTDERLRLVRNACIFTGLFIIFWIPIGLYLTVYDLPNEIVPAGWKTNYLVSMRTLQRLTTYFILSIPLLLFTMSDGLRESFCFCFSSSSSSSNNNGGRQCQQQQQQQQNQFVQSPPLPHASSMSSWNRHYHDLCCICCCHFCCETKGTRNSMMELSVL